VSDQFVNADTERLRLGVIRLVIVPVAHAVSALSSTAVGGASVPVAPKPITYVPIPSVSAVVPDAHAPSTVAVEPVSIAA
jgi:hypothetical protein